MDRLQKIVLAVSAAICIGVVSVTAVLRPEPEEAQPAATRLSYDRSAVKGEPKTDDPYYGTLSVPVTKGTCDVALDAAPKLEDGKLDVKFTNRKGNTMGLKLVVYDETDNIIGETGIVKSGEYVESVPLEGTASVGQQIKAKILTYDDATYYSLGSASVTLMVR